MVSPGTPALPLRRLKQLLSLAVLAACAGSAHAGTIQFGFEEPIAGTTYSGVSNLRGWAASTSGIDHVEIWIDGVYVSDIPMGGYRQDVAQAYPGYPDAPDFGFSMAYNYSKLKDGAHTFLVRVVDKDGDLVERTVTTSVAGFANSFVDDPAAVDLSGAQITGSGNTLQIKGMKVEGTNYDVTAQWNGEAQGMRFGGIAQSQNQGGGGGSCVTLPWIAAGTKATMKYTATASGVTTNGTIIMDHIQVGPNGSTIHTNSTATAMGYTTTEQGDKVVTSHAVNNMLYVSRIAVTGTASVMGYSTPINSTITFSPELMSGPAAYFCANQTWVSEPVTQTITGNASAGTYITKRAEGRVLSLNAAVTVPAGTFNTVHTRVDRPEEGTYTLQWMDLATGVLVQQEDYSGATLASRHQLNALN